MRLTGVNDTDIRLDKNGQPVVDQNGSCSLCSGFNCFMQDIWIEMLTEENELLWEDQEGVQAYGYGLMDYLNAEQDEAFEADISAQIIGKLTKRDYIDAGSISLTMSAPTESTWAAHVKFGTMSGQNIKIDIRTDGKEIYVT